MKKYVVERTKLYKDKQVVSYLALGGLFAYTSKIEFAEQFLTLDDAKSYMAFAKVQLELDSKDLKVIEYIK